MTLYRSAVAVCLLAGLISPLLSQEGGKVVIDPLPPERKIVSVNLCDLALKMKSQNKIGNVDTVDPLMNMDRITPPKKYSIRVHDNYKLSYPNQDEFVWTCTGPTTKEPQYFQITKIEKIRKPGQSDDAGAPGAPQFPFDPKLNPKLLRPQKKGTALHSGPPVCAAVGQWYKFSFIAYADGKRMEVDPHFIVTPGDDPNGRMKPTPCPHPYTGPIKRKAQPVKPNQ